jgi:hypothetical protein
VTPRGARAAVAAIAAVCVLAALAGCGGDPDLWARYHAERLLWKARRAVAIARLGLHDPAGNAAARAAGALDRVVSAYPPDRWAAGEALARPRARDVARLSGTAALLRAALDERAEHDEAAELRYADAAAAYAAIDSVAVAARVGEARVLERLGSNDAAAAAWIELAHHAAELDSAGVAPWSSRLAAPREAVRLLSLLGRAAQADSVRASAATRLAAAAGRSAGTPVADDLWDTLAQLQRQSGRYDEARAALRAALSEPGADERRPERVLQLAILSRESRLPDTALVYATWAARDFAGPVALEASRALAHAWEDAGVADSALAVYKRLIEGLPPLGDLAARARLDRARLLDTMGHWEAARAELRALAMMQPTHPCGVAALVEIVRHHVREHEAVFAGVETKHAMDTFEHMLATQGDPGVRLETMMARADVFALTGRPLDAQREYSAAWRQQRSLAAAAKAGWRAARLADSALGDPPVARELYLELARHAADLDVRWQARQHLGVSGAREDAR